jgi:hypothetical protein
VHEGTGSVIGILADGTGGAAEICGSYNAASGLIDAAGLLGGLAGAAVGGWVALAQWEARMITLATLVISGAADYSPGDFTNPAGDMACGMIDDAIGETLPDYGGYEVIRGVLEGAGIDTGTPSFCEGSGGGTVQSICG